MAIPPILLKLGLTGLKKLGQRLRAKKGTGNETPKLFKRLRNTGLVTAATGATGLISKIIPTDVQNSADQVIDAGENVVSKGNELYAIIDSLAQASGGQAPAWLIVVGGIMAIGFQLVKTSATNDDPVNDPDPDPNDGEPGHKRK